MSLLTFNPLPRRCPPAARARPHSPIFNLPKVVMMKKHALPPLQMEEKVKPLSPEETFSVASRREIMCLTAASLGLLSLPSPASAEAHANGANILQKIVEKFEELGRNIGLLKPKDEAEDKMTKPKDEGGERKPKVNEEEAIKKAKPENGGNDKKPTDTSQQSDEKPSVPAPPAKSPNAKPTVPAPPAKSPDSKPSVPSHPSITNGKTATFT